MKTTLSLFMRDVRRIIANPAAVLITVGVCIIPSLYAWINILANWNPYENTSTVPVAVAVEDEGADVAGMGRVDAGAMIRERLEENDQLGWEFVSSADEARSGVESGRYYAAFVIPADFTSTLAGALEGGTDKARIDYYVNEKANAIAPKVTDTGATELETQISEEFVRVAATAASEKLTEAARGGRDVLTEASGGMAGDLRAAAEAVSGLEGSVDGALGTIDASREAIAQASDTLDSLSTATSDASDTLAGALEGLAGARTASQTLVSKLGASAAAGSLAVSGISSTANYDIGALAGDIGWAQGKIDAAIAEMRSSLATLDTLLTSLKGVRDDIAGAEIADGASLAARDELVSRLDAGIQALEALAGSQGSRLDELEAASDRIKASADSVKGLSDAINSSVQDSSQALAQLQAELGSDTLPQISQALDDVADMGGRLEGTLSALGPLIDQAKGTLEQVDGLMGQAADDLGQLKDGLASDAGRLRELAADVSALESASVAQALERVLGLDPQAVGAAMVAPVTMDAKAVFPVANYGSGVAPFYTNLALWVGGFILVAIYKLEVDGGDGAADATRGAAAAASVTPRQAFFARWLLLAGLGQVQAIICCAGDMLLGMQCVSPVAFVLAGMAASLAYVSAVFSLAVAFKHIGKALGVLLVVLQIPGAAGTYPIEMMPGFFRAIHPWLPFTYGIGAMREAVAGFYGGDYALDLAALALVLALSLALGVACRERLAGVNALFDRRLGATDLMIGERVEGAAQTAGEDLAPRTAPLHAAHAVDPGGSPGRLAGFDRRHPRLVRRCLFSLVWVPVVLVAVAQLTHATFAVLACWVISLIVACGLMIASDYARDMAGDERA